MTDEPSRNYTDLDFLKQIAAQGMISARSIEKVLARFMAQNPEFANNEDIRFAIRHADVIKAQLMGVNSERVFKSDNPEHYSDGRPVVSTVDAGGAEYKHVWFADPDHQYNHPSEDDEIQPGVATVSNATGRIFKLFVAESHQIGVIELGDEEQDRG